MCGICGVLYLDGRIVSERQIQAMTNALFHRGPDDEGYYFSPKQEVASMGMGFRRLSIIDVAGGHQPMRYGNQIIVFNGEIYNYQELKSECEKLGHQFATQSDTEVLIHLFREYGQECLQKLNGMFAFVIWDEENREIFFARDRLGIKPLYYFYDGKKLVFSSELKSLLRSGEVPLEFDPVGIMDFYSYRFVPGPHTVLKNVKKVLPGSYIRLKNGHWSESAYWSLDSNHSEEIRHQQRDGLESGRNLNTLGDRLYELLSDSVSSQMVSDVPIGAFLSGGVDSSLIAALMVKNSNGKEKIKTFSIGFEKGTGVDESDYARKVAAFLDTEHYEMILTEKDLIHTDSVFAAMNEPVADPTIIPTAVLSEFARKKVKVVLTGEGGDELFAGYNRYKAVLYSQWVKNMPGWFQPFAGRIARYGGRGDCFDAIPDIDPDNWFSLNRDFSDEKLQNVFQINVRSEWKSYIPSFTGQNVTPPSSGDLLNDILDLERKTSLVDRLLMKVDMATMGKSLEARPPYLDHRVVEFAAGVESRYKIRHFKGKYLLRKAAEKLLPKQICWRRKHGFIVPLEKWVGARPDDWLRSTLDAPLLESVGLFDKKSIQKEMEKIYNNKDMQNVTLLWPLIVLSCWMKSLENGS